MTALRPKEIAQRLYSSSRVHVALEHPDQITPEQMRRYWADGFIAVNNVFTHEEVQAAIDGLVHLIQNGSDSVYVELEEAIAQKIDPATVKPEDRENYVRKLMKFSSADPRLSAMAAHPKLVGICQRLLGSAVKMTQDMALLKPPHVGREKPWHQDNAYFNFLPLDGVIGTWTALDPATIENGCMHVIPASHLRGPQPHYHDRDCQLPDELIDVEKDVVVPLEPGGVLFFHGLLFHGTPPNQSAAKRRALQFHFASNECRTMSEEEHEALFLDKGGPADCRHWAKNKPPRSIADRRA